MPDFDPKAYLSAKTQNSSEDFDPNKYLAEKTGEPSRDTADSPGILSRLGTGALNAVNAAGKKIDSYTGAPSREFANDLLKGEGVSEAAQGFKNKFGADPDTAPSAHEIRTRLGVPDFSMRKAMGMLGGPVGRGMSRLFPEGSYPDKIDMGDLATGVATDYTLPLQAVGVPGKVLAGAGKIAARVGEAMTGVPAQEIRTYATHLKEINQAIAKYGPDLSEASDDVRKGFAADIATKRHALNDAISGALKSASKEPAVDISGVLDKLNDAKKNLNPVYDETQINHINDMITKVQKSSIEGKMDLGNLFDTKQFLQDQAAPSYMKDGQIFMPGKKAQAAAKYGAAEARKLLNGISPEIADANNELSLLHSVEQKMNKNLIAPGRPDAALIGAGANESSRNYKNLSRLQDIVGKDFISDAQKLSAQKTFTNPALLPVDTTGKTATRAAIASGAGWLAGGPAGAAVGAASTSPAAVKGLINAGAGIGKVLPLVRPAYTGGMGLLRLHEEPKTAGQPR